MKRSDIKIRLVKKWPKDEILELYKAGGWWKDTSNSAKIKYIIKGSFAFAVAIYKKKAIGMGRVISDGVSDAYIQDVIVLQKYRNIGIGKEIIKTLVDYCLSKNIYWIGLVAEPYQDGFYDKLGFKKMKKYVPMKYKIED